MGGLLLTFGTAMRELGGVAAVPNVSTVTAHPSTASVPTS